MVAIVIGDRYMYICISCIGIYIINVVKVCF